MAMNTWVKRGGGLLAAGVLGVLGLAAAQPDRFSVTRQTEVAAPPEVIYPLLVDFRQFGRWSPWEHLDPAMQREFSGPATGVGAVYVWRGNSEVGQGRMEIIGAEPGRRVAVKLDFIEPFASQNHTEYLLTPGATGTQVRWTMDGPMPFVSKLMSVFVSMDAMIGPDFERGLARLKPVAEAAAKPAAAGSAPG
jgi:uncharacterized protein YndB with AHSA1/START domain